MKNTRNKTTENCIEIELKPERKLYYGNNFGVYSCTTQDTHLVSLNDWGNFVVNGEMQELRLHEQYKAKIKEVFHRKYGKGYEAVSIRQEAPKTIDEQHAYLRTILSESQSEALIKVYPNHDIIDMIKNGTLDYKPIKGFGEKTYIKVKNKIIENFEIQDALVELSKYGVTYKMIKKMISYYNNSSELLIQEFKRNPYVLCEIGGLGFKKVDQYALMSGIEKDSHYRMNAAIEHILGEEESRNGHCWLKTETLKGYLIELTEVQDVDKYISLLDFNGFFIDGDRVGSHRIYKYEKDITSKLLQLSSKSGNFTIENIDEKIAAAEKEQGFSFTDEQKQAIYNSVNHNVIVISGKAGSGKSTILKGVMKVLEQHTYETCAFSGKAAQRIIESTGLKSKTIHRLLKINPETGFTYNKDNPLPQDIIVLDEGSMVSSQLFYNLISAIKDGGKLIVLGDVEQLPPIGAGNPMKDMIDSGVIPVVELTQVHRQALKSGILLAVNQIRGGEQITGKDDSGNTVVGELKDFHIVLKDNSEEILRYITKIANNAYDRMFKDGDIKDAIMDFQFIAPMGAKGILGTKSLNMVLQKIFNPQKSPTLKRGEVVYKVGDKIIKSGNDYDNNVFNGTLGMIEHIDPAEKMVGIKFLGNDHLTYYEHDGLDEIDMAYALTTHRCQGAQFKNVVFALDYMSYILLSRQLVYTGLTRASKKCVLVCENRALRHAIRTNHAGHRNTYLKEMLKEKLRETSKEDASGNKGREDVME